MKGIFKSLFSMLLTWLHKFWLPLAITVSLLGVAVSLTMVLLIKQQATVQISNIPIHSARGVAAAQTGILQRGEHLTILSKEDGWAKVRLEDESTGWVADWLLQRQTPLKAVTPLSETTIVLDPGHGGDDAGASANIGAFEKTYTLQLAERVKATLEAAGARVIMTRESDQIVYLSRIPEVAEKANADAFISFHFDSAPEANSATGYTAYYYHVENGSKDLATDINKAMAPTMPIDNRGVDSAAYLVIKDNTVPAVLLENGYINSDKDFSYIKKKSYQNTIAEGVQKGLNSYFSNLQTQSN
jgi:N-acetylmuramoyl-L-alanine amidase